MGKSYEDEQLGEDREEAKSKAFLYWRRWEELCKNTPGYLKTCLFHLSVKVSLYFSCFPQLVTYDIIRT